MCEMWFGVKVCESSLPGPLDLKDTKHEPWLLARGRAWGEMLG